jgi:hypothetical protein
MPSGTVEARTDDGSFAAAWLTAAAFGHAFDLAPVMRTRLCISHPQEIAFIATSAVSLAFICAWSLLCLRVGICGSGRRTAAGVVLMLAATAATIAFASAGSNVWIMATANGVAAFAMLGRAYPVGVLDGVFGISGEAEYRSDEGTVR